MKLYHHQYKLQRKFKCDHAPTATIARRTVRAGTKVLALLLSVVLPLLLVVIVLLLPFLGSIVLQLFVVHLDGEEWGNGEVSKEQTYPNWST